MIYWVREGIVRQGHMAEARAFARDIVAYDNAQGGPATFRVFHARFGQLNRLLWTAEFADLAELEAWQERVSKDKEAAVILARGIPLFADGGIHDSVFEAL
jgi:hypothetical protein